MLLASLSLWGSVGSARASSTDRLIQSLQVRARLHSDDPRAYDALGSAYIQKGRETGDLQYYALAEKALERSLELDSEDPEAASATMHRAAVYMAEHRFEEALTWAQKALGLGSGDLSAWAIAGDALADMGRYDEASEAYSRLREPGESETGSGENVSPLTFERTSRQSYLLFIRGNTEGAIRQMQTAVETAIAIHMPAENVAWSYGELGLDYFRGGHLDEAARAYMSGLAIFPGYYRDLAGLAQVRAAQDRFREAADLYQQAIGVVPMPVYVEALAGVQSRLGLLREAKKQYELVEFMGRLSSINKAVYNRELALYYADHDLEPAEAVRLARKELEVRRDIYTWDTLAWCLYKNRELPEAAAASSAALALGTKDALIFFHAGMIEAALGHRQRSREYLARCLSINSHFDPIQASLARKTLEETTEMARKLPSP